MQEPSVSVVLPMLQTAADEAREELQDLWAALLANAMQKKGASVRRVYFDLVRRFEPADAVLLSVVTDERSFSEEEDILFQSTQRWIPVSESLVSLE